MKRRGIVSTEQICEKLFEAVKEIVPVIELIRKGNADNEMSAEEFFELADQIYEYEQGAKLYASLIDLKTVKALLKKYEFSEDEKLAMLYLVFNADVKFYVRNSIANHLKKDFPEEIKAIKKHGTTNSGLEIYIK